MNANNTVPVITVFVLTGLTENYEYGSHDISAIVGVFRTRSLSVMIRS